MKSLFKRDSTGKVRVWTGEVQGAKFRTISGEYGGNLITSAWTLATEKNPGKANHVDAAAQAHKEMDAMYTKKRKEGYFDDVADIDKSTLIKPMLAEKFKDYFEDIEFPVYSQPKLDGYRCNATENGLWSRKGDRIISCPHIESIVANIVAVTGFTLDGELYNHEYRDNFNQLQSLISKKKPTEEDFNQTLLKVEYHIYDLVDTRLPFSERHNEVKKLFAQFPELEHFAKLVPTQLAANLDELDTYYGKYLEDGYEGQMVRLDKPYENKRSKTLLKRKEFLDEEFEIVRVEEGLGARSRMAGRVTCKLKDGREFGAGIFGGVKVNQQLWAERDGISGKLATIVFQCYTPDGIPRFPVFKGIREDI